MFLASYRFAGDPAGLTAAYDRLAAMFADVEFALHVAVVDACGITVLDACPSEEAFQAFSTSPEWRAAYAAAGLPDPTIHEQGPFRRVLLVYVCRALRTATPTATVPTPTRRPRVSRSPNRR